jgi:hypothetical protein
MLHINVDRITLLVYVRSMRKDRLSDMLDHSHRSKLPPPPPECWGGSWGKHWSQGSSLLQLIDLLEQVKATSSPQIAMWQVGQTTVSPIQYKKVPNLVDT